MAHHNSFIFAIYYVAFEWIFYKTGQNKADEESLKELTSIVEEVKQVFIQENAHVLSELDILKDKRGKNYTQAQQALINYYSDFVTYFFYMGNASPYSSTVPEYGDAITEIKRLKYKVDVSLNIMFLLLHHEEAQGAAEILRKESLKLQIFITSQLATLKAELEYREKMQSLVEKAAEPILSELKVKIDESSAKSRKIEENYLDKMMELHGKVWPVHLEFREKAATFLISLAYILSITVKNMDNYQIAFLITLAVQILCTIVMIKYQGYFHKKGANTADKEDIAELTRMVESVKSEFVRENAKINSDLDILKDRQGKNFTQAQQAIINFYGDYEAWIACLYNLSLLFYDADKINNVEISIEEKKYKVDISVSLMTLLIVDDKSIELGYQMVANALALTHCVDNTIYNFKINRQTEARLTKVFEEYYYKVADDIKSSMQSDYEANELALRVLRNEFYEKRKELMAIVIVGQGKFKKFAQDFLEA